MKLEPANMFCPVCGDGYHMYHLIGEDIEHLDLKCTNCNSYFNLYELLRYGLMQEKSVAMPYNILKPMTNADRVRAKTDEELEDWYWWMHKEMMYYTDSHAFVHEWLKQEIDDG